MRAPILEETLNEIYAFWQENGYVVVDDVFSQEELDEMTEYFEDFKKSGEKVYKEGKVHDEIDPTKDLLRAIHPHRVSKAALNWMTHPRVAQVLEKLFGRPAFAVQSMYYYKPPGSIGQQLHQDNFYLLAHPRTCMAAWTPVDNCDAENGCLRVIPGSHREEIICPEGKPLSDEDKKLLEDGALDESHLGGRTPVEIPLRRGQTMFFNGQLVHGSRPNVSKTRSRRTFIGHYVEDLTESMSGFYFPIHTMDGEVVEHVEVHDKGGACADLPDWAGAVH